MPCDTGMPIENPSFVPWIPMGPPSRQERSTFENAEMPSARGPYGPVVGETTNRWRDEEAPAASVSTASRSPRLT